MTNEQRAIDGAVNCLLNAKRETRKDGRKRFLQTLNAFLREIGQTEISIEGENKNYYTQKWYN